MNNLAIKIYDKKTDNKALLTLLQAAKRDINVNICKCIENFT